MPTTSVPQRNHAFYWDSIIIQVDNCLFKVPRDHLAAESPAFSGMLSLPQGDQRVVEGESDEHPVVFPPDISKNDFETFLRVLYSQSLCHDNQEIGKEDWLAVLRLSDMWECNRVRDVAVREITCRKLLSAIERVELGQKYHVKDWLRSGLYELLQTRGKLSISEEDADRLGFPTFRKLYIARERLRAGDHKPIFGQHASTFGPGSSTVFGSYQPAGMHTFGAPSPPETAPKFVPDAVNEIIDEEFAGDLASMD